MPTLILKRGTAKIDEITFQPDRLTFTIGSDPDNDYVVKDANVSPRHVEFQKIDGDYYIFDLKSESGTKLNGLTLVHEQQIVDGDEIAMGDLSVIFEFPPTGAELEEYRGELEEDFLGRIDHHLGESGDSEQLEIASEQLELTCEQLQTAEANESEDAAPEESNQITAAIDFQELDDVTAEFPTSEAKTDDLSNEPQYYLQAVYGPYLGKKYPLNLGETKIGRDSTLNDIVIRYDEKGKLDPSISRRHATLSYRDGAFYVTDKRSKTRTYVNQTKLEAADEAAMHVGDEIEIVSDQKSTIMRITTGDLDVSPPKKAGVWWIRNSIKLGVRLSATLCIATFTAFALSYLSKQELSKKPDQLTFAEDAWLWSHKVETEAGQTDFTRRALDRTLSLALADMDGDEDVDIVITDPQGRLKVIDSASKEALWQVRDWQVIENIPVVLSDLNQNDLQDILVVSSDTRLRALDGTNGTEIWISPILGDQISGPPGVSDLDGDGLKDLVICTVDGRIHLGYGQLNQLKWVTIETGRTIRAKPAAADWDGDGLPEVFVGTEDGQALIVDGQLATVKETLDIAAEIAAQAGEAYRIRYPMALVDLNADSQLDLVVGSNGGEYVAIDGRNRSTIWSESLPNRISRFAQNLGPAVGDCNGDAMQDLVIVSNQVVRVVRGSGEPDKPQGLLWNFEVDDDLFSTPVTLADFNKDGARDVVVGTRKGSVYVLDGKNGQPFAEIKNPWNAIASPLLVGDLKGNGFLDVSYIREDGGIYVMESNSMISENSVVWGQSHGDERHIGQYAYVGPSSKLYNFATSASGLLFVCMALLTVSARHRRLRTIHRNQKS